MNQQDTDIIKNKIDIVLSAQGSFEHRKATLLGLIFLERVLDDSEKRDLIQMVLKAEEVKA